MSKLPILLLGLCALFLSGCALFNDFNTPQLTPLEIQSLQTREYSASKELVFASVVSVFQDLGYTIESASQRTGFISAKSLLNFGEHYTATAFVETIGTVTQVRLSFIKMNSGTAPSYSFLHEKFRSKKYRTEKQVLDAALYQNAFERIESAIFLRSSR